MSDLEKIKSIIELQIGFNNKLSGNKWRESPPPYLDAIWTEAVEAYNHTNWEWWKNIDAAVEYDQIKMEVIDILHFLISETLANTPHDTASELAEIISESYEVWLTQQAGLPKTVGALKYAIKKFINTATSTDFADHQKQILTLWAGFLTFMYILEMDWTEVYKLYVGKNLLNTFRQANGYKQNSDVYKAKWREVEGRGWEDNQFLTVMLDSISLDKPVNELQEDILRILTSKFEVTQ